MKSSTLGGGPISVPVAHKSWQFFVGFLILLAMSVSLSGCQTIKRYQCHSEDWAEVGKRDGEAGKIAQEQFSNYQSRCTASGAFIEQSDYMAGYQLGLATFCTYHNATKQAYSGYENNGLCTADFGPAFDEGFAHGLETLCTTEGGQTIARRGFEYRGTCPAEAHQEFLTSYISTLEVLLPQAVADVTIEEQRTTSLQSTIDMLEFRSLRFDTRSSSSVGNGDELTEKRRRARKARVSSKLRDLEREKDRADDRVVKSRRRTARIQDMLLRWKPELDSLRNEATVQQ